jgi:hypothetical protein
LKILQQKIEFVDYLNKKNNYKIKYISILLIKTPFDLSISAHLPAFTSVGTIQANHLGINL